MVRSDRREPEQFSFEIVIGEKFINTPEAQTSQRWRKQMGMNVDKRRRGEHVFHSGVIEWIAIEGSVII